MLGGIPCGPVSSLSGPQAFYCRLNPCQSSQGRSVGFAAAALAASARAYFCLRRQSHFRREPHQAFALGAMQAHRPVQHALDLRP